MPAGSPPYSFFDVASFYSLNLGGEVCEAGSAIYRRAQTPNDDGSTVATRPFGGAPVIRASWSEDRGKGDATSHMFERADLFWEQAPVLMASLCEALPEGMDPDYQLRVEVWSAYRDEEPLSVPADDARLWVSLLDHSLGTSIISVQASVDPRTRQIRSQIQHVVRYEDARDIDLTRIAKTWSRRLLEPDRELESLLRLGRS